jgi:hypothetical protein
VATEVQLRLPGVEAPRSWRMRPAEVHAGKVWLPRCREALREATEVHAARWERATEVHSVETPLEDV